MKVLLFLNIFNYIIYFLFFINIQYKQRNNKLVFYVTYESKNIILFTSNSFQKINNK